MISEWALERCDASSLKKCLESKDQRIRFPSLKFHHFGLQFCDVSM
jgi:hypothetical protein